MIPRRSRLDSLVSSRSSGSVELESIPRRSRLNSLGTPPGSRTGSRPPSTHAPSSFVSVDAPVEHEYPHVSVFRNSSEMEVHVRSPFVKMTRPPGFELARSLPVFDVHNKVEGTVLLDARICATPGRLSVSMEGSLVYISPTIEPSKMTSQTGMHRHTFFLTSLLLPVDAAIPRRRSNSRLREAIAASVRSRRERRPSQTSFSGALRPFPFSFEVPPPSRPGEELPSTFCSIVEGLNGVRARAFVERAEIMYKLTATWESNAGDEQITVNAPIVFQPEHDFESLDGRSLEPESWIEIPLRSERPIPFTCAVALPDMPSFSRSASIPYYVVFTTTPRSPTLAHEIVVDATIAVSLLREVNIDVPPSSPSSPSVLSPASASSSSSFSDEASSFILGHKTKLMKRMVSSAPPILSRKQLRAPLPLQVERPPGPPQEGYSETRTLYMDVSVGFPKRPRIRVNPGQQHPSLTAHTLLPDGLYKAKLQLNEHMIPSIEWADLSVKYFLEVSVLFGQDETRTRIPVRLV